MSDHPPPTPILSIEAQVESLLFVSSGPVSVGRLARTLEISTGATKRVLEQLDASYRSRGIRLQWSDDGVQLTTAPESSLLVERFLGLEAGTTRLSPAALEVLAIVAYMQPITRPHVDQIRGVNSDGALRTLLSKGLLEEVGRLDGPGRPILYGTTPQLMQQFGLSSMDELPPLPTEEDLEAENADGTADQPVESASNEVE